MKIIKYMLSTSLLFMLCSCTKQNSTLTFNQAESNSIETVYDTTFLQNDKVNILVYEYLNGKWNERISEFHVSSNQKIVLTLHEPTLEDDSYYLQIISKSTSNEDVIYSQQISFKEKSEFYHHKNISNLKIKADNQNLAIYEWYNDKEKCIYDLTNFNLNNQYSAKRAYLIMICLCNT